MVPNSAVIALLRDLHPSNPCAMDPSFRDSDKADQLEKVKRESVRQNEGEERVQKMTRTEKPDDASAAKMPSDDARDNEKGDDIKAPPRKDNVQDIQVVLPSSAASVPSAATARALNDDEDDDNDGTPKRSTFAERLMELLNSEDSKGAMWWLPSGDSFAIKPKVFTRTILNEHFQGTKLESFTRKLNRWGFKRVAGQRVPPNTVAYYHILFQKDKPELVKEMNGGKKKNQDFRDAIVRRELHRDLSLLSAGVNPAGLETANPASQNTDLIASLSARDALLVQQRQQQQLELQARVELMRSAGGFANSVMQPQQAQLLPFGAGRMAGDFQRELAGGLTTAGASTRIPFTNPLVGAGLRQGIFPGAAASGLSFPALAQNAATLDNQIALQTLALQQMQAANAGMVGRLGADSGQNIPSLNVLAELQRTQNQFSIIQQARAQRQTQNQQMNQLQPLMLLEQREMLLRRQHGYNEGTEDDIERDIQSQMRR